MSAIAIVLAEMGHTVSGSDVREQPVLDRLRAAGVDVTVGHDRDARRRLRRGHGLDGVPPSEHRARAARERGIPSCGGPACWRRSAPRPGRSAVAGTHGKTTTTSMLMLDPRRGRAAPELRHRRRRRRHRHRRPVDRRRLARRRGRRERRHAPRAAAARHDPDQRRARPPRPLRHVRRIVESFDSTSPDRRAEGRVRRRPAAAPRLASRVTARRPTALAERRDVRAVDVRSGGGSFSVRRRAGGPPPRARCALPLRGMHNVRNATGAIAMAREPRRRVRGVRGGARPLRRRRPAVRHPRRRRRGHVRRRLRPPAGRDRRGARRGPRRAATAGGGSSPCSSRTGSTGWP